MVRKAFEISLKEKRELAPDIMHFVFERTDGAEMAFIPGQFITLMLAREGKLVRRSYSLASAPNGSSHVEFAASYVPGGFASELLFNLQAGDVIEATGPFGRLILPEEQESRYIFVATGTGITPYRAMLPALAERLTLHNAKVVFCQGMRTNQEMLYSDEFTAFAKAHANFTYYPCVSREEPSDAFTHGRRGYVQDCFAELDLQPEADLFFLCGNPNMIDVAFADLTEKGFATPRLKREKYISSN